ncbi:MAG TPA: GNAT family N-acetyltransferase [Gordonia sp. (in: high G+C Gram-positive bacteria)]|uniref:GNAT family N-acetyltransferase n=1 Tax=unclassified Gordonia (in: high G+C Gram-positive bacteria) TaxID=2657482 RepID=UPI000FACCD16|nr:MULTISPECIES: GNAT family N-acetyltransferase [unclassified Gordonia (in: high G+C Gram-positive bacteria)]RUP40439.1 MAG: GNAT family N-acetyltransferase [Gordonia sp. (in: high G+C Gram-positive bacteria)]HNP58551.1 GNAT family N-acetyltransferase [Gordonia sp. (in: high G+C Gram-positive bacteria)]HRC52150.1 GNAT family N-acetyltransferase [Gordonia sp. (in: high G+C Gram-positive bacteria)]
MLTRRRQPLQTSDALAVARALAADPVATCMVAARVESYGIEPRWLGGQLWSADDPEFSLCFSGANLIPLVGADADLDYFAESASTRPRECSSIVGPAELALGLWERLEPAWGSAREVRAVQPLMALRRAPRIAEDPEVRLVTRDDLSAYFPAAVEMFTSEIGVDPCAFDGGRAYRQRLAGLIDAGRVFARFDDGRVVFKAEIGALSHAVGQIQGVWVDPEYRDSGLGKAGTAAVAAAIRAHGRTPSLYVNDFNVCARRAYEAVGFEQVGTFATVLID